MYQVDPETNELDELARVDQQHGACDGIGYGFDVVWTCADDGDLVTIDPETGEVGGHIVAGKTSTQGHLGTGFDRVWVLQGDGSQLAGLDPGSLELDPPVALGVRGTDLRVGEDGVWVWSAPDDTVVRVDPGAGQVDLRVPRIENPTSVAFADDAVWIGGSHGLYRLDPGSGTVDEPIGGGTGLDGFIDVSTDCVWVHGVDPFARQVDLDTGRPVVELVVDGLTSGGDALVAFDSLWATSYDDQVVHRVRID